MKTHHRIPSSAAEIKSDPITPEYQAEIDKTMQRAEQAWKRARKRLANTERRLERARAAQEQAHEAAEIAKRRKRIEELEALVEARRIELEQVHRLMVAHDFGAKSRGKKSFRPVPQVSTPL